MPELPPRPPGNLIVDVTSVTQDGEILVVGVTLPVPTLAVLREPPPADPWAPEPHTIIVPMAAIDGRQTMYGLATRYDALIAILKEHAKRLSALDDGDESPDPRINAMGGLRSDVEVNVPSEIEAALAALLGE